jgi:hypothetical protein
VDKDLCNEVIRRISTIVEDGKQHGLMVVAQDLLFSSGSLEL